MCLILIIRECLQCPVGFFSGAENLRTVVQNTREYHKAQVQILFLGKVVQNILDLIFFTFQCTESRDDDLGDHGLAALDLKVLDILVEQLGDALALDVSTDREHIGCKLIDIQVCDGCQDIRGAPVLFGGRRGLEFQCIREDRSKKKTGEILRDRDLVLTEHSRNDSRRTAYDLISESDRPLCGEIVDPVMVDNFQYFCLIDSADRLGEFVVVHKDDLLVAAVHDVVARRAADDPVVLIDDRIGVIAGAHHLGSDILRELVGIELDDLGRHDLADRIRRPAPISMIFF